MGRLPGRATDSTVDRLGRIIAATDMADPLARIIAIMVGVTGHDTAGTAARTIGPTAIITVKIVVGSGADPIDSVPDRAAATPCRKSLDVWICWNEKSTH